MKSIMQNEKECFVCKNPQVHLHHVLYGTSNRKLSDKYGLTVWLCPYHHNMSNEGVHNGNKELDTYLKRYAQECFEREYKELSFIKIFGKSYL